jgi:hypothetical protein
MSTIDINTAINEVKNKIKNDSSIKFKGGDVDDLRKIVTCVHEDAHLKVEEYGKWNQQLNGYGYIKNNDSSRGIEVAIPGDYSFVGERETYFQQRFTVFHEIGHLMLHLSEDKLHLNHSPYRERTHFFEEFGRASLQLENEADDFAYAVLAPKNLFEHVYRELKNNLDDYKGIDMETLLSFYFEIPSYVVDELLFRYKIPLDV